MPAPLYYAHEILRAISKARHSGAEKTLGPDAKSQVTVRYHNGKPVEATQIVVSHQHLVESLTSEDVAKLATAYEDALSKLQLSNRTDPIATIIAQRIIEAAKTGVRDSAELCALAIKDLRVP